MNYWLKLYDENLIKFIMNGKGTNIAVDILYYTNDRQAVMPIGVDGSNESLEKWLANRTIPKNRAYVHNILNSMGLSFRDTAGILTLCKGLSLNDSYWIVPEDFDGKFADYNLYENRFAEILALTALTGESLSENQAKKIKTSPEFTTQGMLPKAWRNIDGKITLFKGGVWRKYATTDDPLEPYSEFYACQIAEKMGLNPVLYGLSRWKGILGSTCKLFTDINTAYVPISAIAKKYYKEQNDYYLGVSKWYKEFDEKNDTNLYDYFASIIALDALIYNEDRHLNNFGLLRDNKTGRIIGNAPVFDNGISLFNYSSMNELIKIDEHRKAYENYFKQPFEDAFRAFSGKKQGEQLQQLLGFKFKKHPRYNWKPERMKLIEEFIQFRLKELLDIIN